MLQDTVDATVIDDRPRLDVVQSLVVSVWCSCRTTSLRRHNLNLFAASNIFILPETPGTKNHELSLRNNQRVYSQSRRHRKAFESSCPTLKSSPNRTSIFHEIAQRLEAASQYPRSQPQICGHPRLLPRSPSLASTLSSTEHPLKLHRATLAGTKQPFFLLGGGTSILDSVDSQRRP